VRKADNLPPSCAVVTKSGSLNCLEPSGPVQACNGTALPLPLHLLMPEDGQASASTVEVKNKWSYVSYSPYTSLHIIKTKISAMLKTVLHSNRII